MKRTLCFMLIMGLLLGAPGYAQIHEGVTRDRECLDCHHPDRNPAGPPTPHPGLSGCLKCHNDELKSPAS
ncbi:MAG: hypothetical protein JRH05_03730 [Deltaproteobacteria bacterium]|nr:hypothetical protein [Deltaproteobacteria bacterium]